MSPKRRTLLSLIFACICLSKSLLIITKNVLLILSSSHLFSDGVSFVGGWRWEGGGGGMLLLYSLIFVSNFKKRLTKGPVPESNPGPLAPKARIIPLDQQAHMTMKVHCRLLYVTFVKYWYR